MRAVSRCRPRQQAAQGQDAERRVLQKASVVRRPSCPVGCPSGARPAPTRGYQRRPFCPASTTTRALRGFANNSKTQSAVSDFLSHTKQRTQERNQTRGTCLFHSPPAAAHAGRREHLRRQLAMSSLAEQISQWESEERAYLVHQTRTRARQDHSQDPACSAREDEAFQLSATLSRTPAPSVARSVTPERLSPLRQTMLELADASGGRMLLPSPPRTPTSASSRRSLAEQGEAHSLRRRRMWEAEQQAKQDHAAVRPRQCTTQREYFGDFAVASSVQPAGGTHSCHSGGPHPLTGPEDRGNNFHQAPEDRAVCAALELAYADGDVFFTYGGTALHHAQSAPPLAAPQARLLRLLRALGSSALPGRGQPTGRPATALGARASRFQSRRFHGL